MRGLNSQMGDFVDPDFATSDKVGNLEQTLCCDTISSLHINLYTHVGVDKNLKIGHRSMRARYTVYMKSSPAQCPFASPENFSAQDTTSKP